MLTLGGTQVSYSPKTEAAIITIKLVMATLVGSVTGDFTVFRLSDMNQADVVMLSMLYALSVFNFLVFKEIHL